MESYDQHVDCSKIKQNHRKRILALLWPTTSLSRVKDFYSIQMYLIVLPSSPGSNYSSVENLSTKKFSF